MPLNKISLDSIMGLSTNRNDTAGINSPDWSSMSAWGTDSTSAGATPPNTLMDCRDVIITRDRQAAARFAFTTAWDFTSTFGSDSTFKVKGIFSIPNTTTNSLIYSWANSTTANIGNFSTSVNYNTSSNENIIGGVESTNFVSKAYLISDFSWNAAQVPTLSFTDSRYTTSNRDMYVFGSNGVFRTTIDYLADITNLIYNKFKKVVLPVVRNLSAQITASPADANRWFAAGQLVDIKVIVTEQLNESQVYQGKPSRTLTIQNISTLSSIQLTVAIDNTNLLLPNAGIEVYRTTQYAPGSASPAKFYKCYESVLTAGTTVSNVTTFTNIELTLNDTSLQGFEEIYTSLNRESAQLPSGGIISAETCGVPTARDIVTTSEGFTGYIGVYRPPFATLTMTGLPTSDGLDKLQVGATTIFLTYTANSTTPPANTGVIDATSGTFSGVNSSPNGGKGYNIVIRPQDPTVTSSGAAYSVPYYAIASTIALSGGTGSTSDIVITPKTGSVFDITKFSATGIIAVINGTATGYVVALFSYQSYTQDTAAGTYTFSNCLAYGVDFADSTWTTIASSGTYVLYPLNGTTVTGLPVYAIGSDATGYSNQVGFSLVPTYEKYPGRPFNNTIVGSISATNKAASGGPFTASINFFGIYSLSAAELLDNAVRTATDAYNSTRTPEDPYAVYVDSPTAPVGQIRFESIYAGYNQFSTFTTSSSTSGGFGFYDEVKARVFRVSGTPQVTFAEPITSSLSNIMQEDPQSIAGVSFSKLNKPEEIAIDQILTPTIVGDPLRPAIKAARLYTMLFVFKQEEGVYRVDLRGAGAGILPTVSAITLLDNTAWLLLPESVQAFEGNIVYFSTKGFAAISTSGQVTPISSSIESEVLNLYSILKTDGNINKVKSFVIAQQRLYGCVFPNVNPDNSSVTYIFNAATGQWTKWTGEIDQITVSKAGQVSFAEPFYTADSTIYTSFDLNNAVLNLSTGKYWTVLKQADFSVISSNQIEENINLSGFTITPLSTEALVTISNFSNSTVYGNLYRNLLLFKDRDFWYRFSNGSVYRAILSNAQTDTFITLSLVDNENNVLTTFPYTPSTSDSILAAVDARLYFNKFFTAQPRGSTLSHYVETQIYNVENEVLSNLYLGFRSTPLPSFFIVDVLGNFVIDNVGDFVTTAAGVNIDDQFGAFYILQSSKDSFRVLVPKESARGRFIQLAIKHNTPNEFFKLNSIVQIYRDERSSKIKVHSS